MIAAVPAANSAADKAIASDPPGLRLIPGSALAIASAVAFHIAFLVPALFPLVIAQLGCLFALRRVTTPRQAFYLGLAAGMGVYPVQMGFLWSIFGAAALPLWLILAVFYGLFVVLLQRVEFHWGPSWTLSLAPVLWCGIEYFRSEVWWLRFSWFTSGTCIPSEALGLLRVFGIYGTGMLAALAGAAGCRWIEVGCPPPSRRQLPAAGLATLTVLAVATGPRWLPAKTPTTITPVKVAGLQLEFPGVPEVRIALDRLRTAHPDAQLLQLSEYTFEGPVPEPILAWCRRNSVWLIAGGREAFTSDGDGDRFFNTAFVVNPGGTVAFSQAKSRPIQFFRDGEPAKGRRVWESPWGSIGIAICYDASYRRVMDDLVKQGARALLIPTMDLEAWGAYQHQLNARMAGLRAMEYGLPVFRVASSGISMVLDHQGAILASAPFPGPGAMIAGTLNLRPARPARRWIPLDAWLAPACTIGTAFIAGLLLLTHFRNHRPGSLRSS
ncbi:MAG: hypothetical protein KF791_19475 [Verrucomicrobiae bacterium]|nr:hypothetical protein [Verrucomicrobiae bacterium]